MKRLLLILVILSNFIYQDAIAQIFAVDPTGTTVANIYPLASTTTNRRNAVFYPSNFPGAPAGNIIKVYFKVSAAVTSTFTNFVVRMGNTSLMQFTTGPWITTGMNTVFSQATFTVTSATVGSFSGQWIEVPLSTPFYYDATQNFIVDFSHEGYTTAVSVMQLNAAGLTARTMFGGLTGTGSQQDRLTQIAIELAPASCSGAPNVPTISGPSTAACGGTSVALISAGHSTGTYFTYQWQSRPAGSTASFTDEAAGVSPNYNPAPIQSTEYQLVTKCTSSGMTSTSNKIVVNVAPNPFIGSINESHTGLAYTFTGVGVQNATSLNWDYGDGFTGTTGMHTYASAGNYTVKLTATNACGNDARQIMINASPNIPCTIPDKPSIIAPGEPLCLNAMFDLTAIGYTINTNISFQWQSAPEGSTTFTDIPGATGTTLTTSETVNTKYRIISSCASTGNEVISDEAGIEVIQPSKIATPENVSVQQYENAVFNVSSSISSSPVTYRWQSSINGTPWVYVSDNGNYRGANTPQLMILNATIAQDSMLFRCVLEETGGCNYVPDTSAAAILRVSRTTAVNTINKSAGISVYPNPVSGSELFIYAEGLNAESLEVSVIDNIGRVVSHKNIDIRNNVGIVDVASLPSGLYQIRIANNVTYISSLKFTKE